MRGLNLRERPTVARAFFKGHGLGNDYLVLEEGTAWRATPEAVGRLCHRWEGVGSDGIVVLARGSGPPFRLRMFNPDGSEFERSGNGLRIVAAHLFRTGRVGAEPFEVEVGGERVRMQIHGADGRGEYDISVEMGRALRGPEAVEAAETTVPAPGLLDVPEVGPLLGELISVGNPHCVVFGESEPWRSLEHDDLERLGSALTAHPVFARGVNVQLARILATDRIEFLVWERGVGHTSASGTSACAVAVAAVASGRLPPGEKTLVMEGGTLSVRVSESLDVVLRGPARAVCDGDLDAGFVRVLGGGRLPEPDESRPAS